MDFILLRARRVISCQRWSILELNYILRKHTSRLCGWQWSALIVCHLLTHWGRVTHICVSKPTIIGSDNGLSPKRRQAIIWTNAGILLIGPLGTNFSENSIEILTFSFMKIRLKVSSAKWRPFCLGLNMLSKSCELGHHPLNQSFVTCSMPSFHLD